MSQNAKYEGPGNQITGTLVIAGDNISHTLISAQAGLSTDIVQLIISNGSNTNTHLTVSDGTVNYPFEVAPMGGFVVPLGEYPFLASNPNTAWTAQLTVGANVSVIAQALKVQR